MSRLRVVADFSDRSPVAAVLQDAVDSYNLQTTGDREFWPINLALRDEDGALHGGLVGMVWGGWLEIRVLWLEEPLRGAGYGSQLLREAEDYARARGARHAHLASFTFQAPAFYEKHGYVRFAELADYPPGQVNVFLRKALHPPTPAGGMVTG